MNVSTHRHISPWNVAAVVGLLSTACSTSFDVSNQRTEGPTSPGDDDGQGGYSGSTPTPEETEGRGDGESDREDLGRGTTSLAPEETKTDDTGEDPRSSESLGAPAEDSEGPSGGGYPTTGEPTSPGGSPTDAWDTGDEETGDEETVPIETAEPTGEDTAGDGNLIAGENGGFENGLDGWTPLYATPDTTTDPDDVHSGDRALVCGPDETFWVAYDLPVEDFEAGRYRFSVFGKVEGPRAWAEAGLFFKGLDGDWTPQWTALCPFSDEAYVECVHEFDIPPGLMQLSLAVNKGPSSGSFFVDDFSIAR